MQLYYASNLANKAIHATSCMRTLKTRVNSTISPSTLSKMLDVDDPHFFLQLFEPDAAKSLCEDVRLLHTSPYELHDHHAFLDAVSYELVAKIDVLAAVVKHWVRKLPT